MAVDPKQIQLAFASGSGMNVGDLATVGGLTVFTVVAVLAITALFKRLKAFEKDDNQNALINDALVIVYVVIIILLIVAVLVEW